LPETTYLIEKDTQMTKRTTKKTAPHTQAQPQPEKPTVDLPAPETVVRYELLGACDFTLVDPGERLPEKARQALFDLQKDKGVRCVMQCEGYVFNIVCLPFVTFVDRDSKITGSSAPEPEGDAPPKEQA
jgi:hypothetical protein